jgi:uncharacterized membrane protein
MDGESTVTPGAPEINPPRGLVEYAHLIYGLHTLTVVCALLTMKVPALRFAFSLPSLVAIIMSYLRRAAAQGTWLESHFSWQIRTFWYAWLWTVVTAIIAIPLLLFGVSVSFWITLSVFLLILLWVMYRIGRGWLALRDARPTPLSMV